MTSQETVRESKHKLAVLSNINLNFVIRKLKKEFDVYDAEGYGNELGTLLNPASSYYSAAPEVTFLVMDLAELSGQDVEPEASFDRIRSWFQTVESVLKSGTVYYISDAYFWNPQLGSFPYDLTIQKAEAFYHECLSELFERHENVRILPVSALIRRIGEERAFSLKMWYLGKILYSNEMQGELADLIAGMMRTEFRVPKKVLAVDLDNTLWGGLAGERDHQEIRLSEDHEGLAYKNAQRVLKQMKDAGVLLAIVSKNNEADAVEILEHHPHMALQKADFAAIRINWNTKDLNLREIAAELNLGLDSFVFWDDQPAERQLIREVLPQVEVPEFPEQPEELAGALTAVYNTYFRKARITSEDRSKTLQYAQNRERKALEDSASDFGTYLKNLEIRIEQCDPGKNTQRFLQLVNKTNQFNLTTKRYTLEELEGILENASKRAFLFRLEDRFGEYGITGAAIVDLGGVPTIEEWVLSCRVMGKRVEYAILDRIEKCIRQEGYDRLRGIYIPTAKNEPVRDLYESCGFQKLEELSGTEKSVFEISLFNPCRQEYYVKWTDE